MGCMPLPSQLKILHGEREEREGEKEKRNFKKGFEIYYFLHIGWPVYLVVHSSFLKNSEESFIGDKKLSLLPIPIKSLRLHF